MWWWAVGLALASPPGKSPMVWEAGTGEVRAMTAASDRGLVAFTDTGTGDLHVLDMEDWSLLSDAPCEVSGVAVLPVLEGDARLIVACEDGTLAPWTLEDGALDPEMDDDGEAVVWEVSENPILGVHWPDDSEVVYAISESSTGALQIDAVDLTTGEIDSTTTLVFDGYVDSVLTDGWIVVSHGSDDMSGLSIGGSSATANVQNLSISVEDIAPGSSDTVWAVSSSGSLLQYLPSAGSWAIVTTDLGDPTGVLSSVEDEEEWVGVGRDDEVAIYEVDGSTVDGEPSVVVQLGLAMVDGVAAGDGYSFAGTEDGSVALLTPNPWISDVHVASDTAVEGSTVPLSFKSDSGGDWEIRVGGDRSGNGEKVAEGELDEAGSVDVELEVDDAWAEGVNPIYVFVTDSAGNRGHAQASVTVDNPPDAPTLTDASVGFGDGSLLLSFDGIEDEDLDHYVVYVTTTPFSGDEWPTEGPDFDGEDDLDAPITVSSSGGEHVTVTLSPLTNGTTYYIGVRALDAGGLESPMSNVVQGVPRQTFTAAELAGEGGGLQCATGGGPVGLFGGAVALLALLRRRRLPVLAAAFLAASAPVVAEAQPLLGERVDLTPQRASMGIRYGSIQLQDDAIETVYGSTGNNILYLEVSPQLFQVLEVNFGVGFFQELAWTVDEDGNESSERTMLTWYPLAVGATVRGQLWDEQVLVPFGRIGLTYVPWSEIADDGSGSKDKLTGGKVGQYFAVGGALLLDVLAPSRASLLEANSGINDTFLTVEWRRQMVEGTSGFTFSGDALTVGLELAF